MSFIAVGYAVDLGAVSDLELDERRQFVEIGIDDLKQMNRGDEDTRDVLEIIFGLRSPDAKYRDLADAFRWFCRNFGSAIGSKEITGGVYELELETELVDAVPPFGFPAGDENVTHLAREDVLAERERFGDTADSAATPEIAQRRATFLNWLDSCENSKTDLVVIQS